MKKILVIHAHPYDSSYNRALAETYIKSAKEAGAAIEEIFVTKLQFKQTLEFGYTKRTELEPDLVQAWEKIKRADHIVVVSPIWWGGIPGPLKSFFDRLFLPGMAFKYRENSPLWDKLLTGKTAHLILTMDTPTWYFALVYFNSGIVQLKKNILGFCGIKTTKTTIISPIRNSSQEFRNKWLKKVEALGKSLS